MKSSCEFKEPGAAGRFSGSSGQARAAGFQACRIAGFPAGTASERPARQWWFTLAFALAVALFGLASSPNGAAAEMAAAQSASQPTQWTVSYDGKPVMVYASDPQRFKPYVQALNTLAGYGVLRDSPFDHLHHHALMYGIKVNGINFWEETTGCGVEKVVETSLPVIQRTPAGLPQATLVQVLYWLAPEDAFLPNTNAPALLIEHRTIVLTLNPERRETALRWQSVFEVGSKTNTVSLTGANYHGLGMRFLRELDSLAVHSTAEGKPDLANSKQDVSAHAWEAVTFDAPGQPATIVLYNGRENARGDARYFSMLTPFAYLSATQGLDKEPLVYHRGDHFELNYLVVLYPEIKTTGALEARAREWQGAGR